MRVAAERLRHDLFELCFDFIDVLARRQAGAVTDAEHVRVDGERLFAERGVEHDISRLAADAGKFLELFPGTRHLAAVLVDQRLAERDDVLRLGVEQANGLDCFAQPFFAEIDHLARRFDAFEQRSRGDIDAGVGRLGGEHDRDEQSVGIVVLELGCG